LTPPHTPATEGIVVEPARREDFAAVLDLNESAIPHVSPLDMAVLNGLAAQSMSFTVARDKAGVVAGFLLVLPDGEHYASLNYRYFADHYPSFAYVDRIVVGESYRGAGIGSRLYSHLLSHAVADKPMVACEVNLRPPNTASVAFHQGLGFVGVDEQDTDGGRKRVLLMVKELG